MTLSVDQKDERSENDENLGSKFVCGFPRKFYIWYSTMRNTEGCCEFYFRFEESYHKFRNIIDRRTMYRWE